MSNSFNARKVEELHYLMSTTAVREICQKIYDLTVRDELNFKVDETKLPQVANYVAEVIRENYPNLDIPYHCRWNHFNSPGVDRLKELYEKTATLSDREKLSMEFGLVIVSVLLDAGAGATWKYLDKRCNEYVTRSEGLAVASLDMFESGLFSKSDQLYQVSGKALTKLTRADIEKGMQVGPNNPLAGAEGRVTLLNNLGHLILTNPNLFPNETLGDFALYLADKYEDGLAGEILLKEVLAAFNEIWPSRQKIEGISLGDAWPHSRLEAEAIVPFHKLSQWLSYSLITPLENYGLKITNPDGLTGLPEYRNGGLFYDLGVIQLRDKTLEEVEHKPSSEIIIEWRALTITLLDKIAPLIRAELKLNENEFPLGKILEGGTWSAGRKIAKSKRPDLTPPLKIKSDGTVF